MRITSFKVTKLFDLFDHAFELKRTDRITILYAPNGYGKTAILKLIDAVTSGNLQIIKNTPFETLTLGFDDGIQLIISKLPSDTQRKTKVTFMVTRDGTPLETKEWTPGEQEYDTAAVVASRVPYMRQIDLDIWEDPTDGEVIATSELMRRFGIDPKLESGGEFRTWLRDRTKSVSVRFIETQRLTRRAPRPVRVRSSRAPHSPDFTSVNNYARQLATNIQSVLANYAEKSQRLDQTFPSRLLARFQTAHQPVITDDELSRQLLELDKKRLRLREAGLLEKEEEMVELPKQVEGEVRRLLGLYLADVFEKLSVFDATLDRMELLREIVDDHFTFKRMKISREHGFRFETSTRNNLPASSLSSGEQHLLILLYELLFAEREGSLFLIDEPEISLHIGWQLSFLSDLERIAKVNDSNVLIATHSPQIIGDRDDLAVPLSVPELPTGAEA